eukprot:TRINITY_DN2040_c0_g1_i3.p1 TRINITY_DN2040_c0_g1~~TRINITY_DN2040_c0_g1_i3.p1  ORF type:complete len:487 (+),score=54.10 TRINITY_DN2040_c0_g1_i3:471-1931(+)
MKKSQIRSFLRKIRVHKLRISNYKEMSTFRIQSGSELQLEIKTNDELDKKTQNQIFELCKFNMEEFYKPVWGWDAQLKWDELFKEFGNYLIVYDQQQMPVAFCIFRIEQEGNTVVVYVYELQLENQVQRQGLGQMMMQLIEQIARSFEIEWIMLTTFSQNQGVYQFYKKLGYNYDESDPQVCDAQDVRGYRILSKYLGEGDITQKSTPILVDMRRKQQDTDSSRQECCDCTVQQFRKWFLVTLYVCTLLVSATFVALAIVTAVELAQEVYNHTAEGEAVRAPLAALILGIIAVVLFMVVSLLTLLRNFWGKGGAGFWYGFMTSSTFYGLNLLLLVGVTLDAFKEEAQHDWVDQGRWDDQSYDIFRATFIFAYILAAWYLAFFVTLVLSVDLVQKRIEKLVAKRSRPDDQVDDNRPSMGAWQPDTWNAKPKDEYSSNTKPERAYGGGSYDSNDGGGAYGQSMDIGQAAYGQSTGAYGQGAYSGAYKV